MINEKALTTILRNPSRPGRQFWNATPAFRFYLLSECAGLLAGSFWLVALPWLAVRLSGSPAALGVTVLLSGVGRVGLVLLGGMLADRVSPHTLLRVASAGRALLFVALAAGGLRSLTGVYVCALTWGMMDAIGLPARGALVPRLVADDDLPRANALLSGIEKLWGALGPALAGAVIGSASATGGLAGVVAAFSASAVLAVAALVCLEQFRLTGQRTAQWPSCGAGGRSMLRLPCSHGAQHALRLFDARAARGALAANPTKSMSPHRLWESLREPLSAIWPDKGLRAAILVVVGVNILTTGPLAIGLPALAVQRFGNHAWLLGLLSSAVAAASLLGSLLAGRYPFGQAGQPRCLAPVAVCGLGLGIVGVGMAGGMAGLAMAVFAFCALTGYLTLGGVTYIQRNAPPECLGRLMGLLNLK